MHSLGSKTDCTCPGITSQPEPTKTQDQDETLSQASTAVNPNPATPLPRAINALQGSGSISNERKFTPMDIDPDSRRASGVAVMKTGDSCKQGEVCEDCE